MTTSPHWPTLQLPAELRDVIDAGALSRGLDELSRMTPEAQIAVLQSARRKMRRGPSLGRWSALLIGLGIILWSFGYCYTALCPDGDTSCTRWATTGVTYDH